MKALLITLFLLIVNVQIAQAQFDPFDADQLGNGPATGFLLQASSTGFADWVATSSLGIVAGVSSITNADGTLTISPTTGDVVASLNLGNANTWTALQTFSSGININSETFTDLTGSGLSNNSGVLTVATSTFNLDPSVIDLAQGFTLVGDPSGNAQATSSLFIDTNGNVGIGSVSPSQKLNVQGEVAAQFFSATSTATSTFAGKIQFAGDTRRGVARTFVE